MYYSSLSSCICQEARSPFSETPPGIMMLARTGSPLLTASLEAGVGSFRRPFFESAALGLPTFGFGHERRARKTDGRARPSQSELERDRPMKQVCAICYLMPITRMSLPVGEFCQAARYCTDEVSRQWQTQRPALPQGHAKWAQLAARWQVPRWYHHGQSS
jgi:hypothetical protein